MILKGKETYQPDGSIASCLFQPILLLLAVTGFLSEGIFKAVAALGGLCLGLGAASTAAAAAAGGPASLNVG